MASASRTAAYKPRADRTGLPLILVTCTGCGLRFTSAARERTTCPDCGRDLRVHRSPRARSSGARLAVVPAPVPPAARPPVPVTPVRQPVAFPGIQSAPVRQGPASAARPSRVDKDDLRLAVRTEAERRRLASLGVIVSDTASPGFCAVQRCPGDGDGLYRHYRWWLCDRHYGQALAG